MKLKRYGFTSVGASYSTMIEIKHIAMLIAERAALKSNCKKRKVGFVVFNETKILAVGVNQHGPQINCQCVTGVHDTEVTHAESVIFGQSFNDDVRAVVTYAPCLPCAVNNIAPSNIKAVYVHQTKHQIGLNYLETNSIATHLEWLTPQQRIQAAWKLKWMMFRYGEYM